MPHTFHIVDVFAEEPYAGNPLAVVLDAGDLSAEDMQRIALEMNYAETTFVTLPSRTDRSFNVRIFTPVQERPFAGHPTLGTAWVLRHELAPDDPRSVTLNLRVGSVVVDFEAGNGGRETVWLTAPPVTLGRTCTPDAIAPSLRLSACDIESRVPIQQLSAGISVTIVPLRGLEALRRSQLDLRAFESLERQGFPAFVYLFCPETLRAEDDLCARFFFDAHGVREDAATGSATACLGAYLLEHDYFSQNDLCLRIEQGYEIQRPSLLMLRARAVAAAREISVGGRVIHTAHGQLT